MRCKNDSNQELNCNIFRLAYEAAAVGAAPELLRYCRAEKLVGSMKYRSMWSTSAPFASDCALTSFHSESAWKAAQFFSAS